MSWMSHNYNGDGVQANEYSALAGGLDMLILRTSATNSTATGGGGGRNLLELKHILQRMTFGGKGVTSKTTLVKQKQ